MIKRNCVHKTAQTIVISRANFRLLVELFQIPEERLNLIHNGIELDRFLDNQDKAELPVQDGDIVVCLIAEFHPRKGQRFLIEAVRSLRQTLPGLQLILVGDGPIKSELEEKCRDHPGIHFLGWRNDIPQILKASDIFVLPSLNEAFGQVLVEAMASGVACIGTDNGGIPDIIKNGETGLLVPPANSEKLAEAMLTLIQNPDQKRDIESSALQWAKQEFSAAKMARETIAVYKKALSK